MMTLLYTMWHLAQGYGVDPEATSLLDNRDLWFVPIVNPDGYEANRRMQPAGGGVRRKNMRDVVTDGDERGVDLNRNWDSHWGIDNIGSRPISNTGMCTVAQGHSASRRQSLCQISAEAKRSASSWSTTPTGTRSSAHPATT